MPKLRISAEWKGILEYDAPADFDVDNREALEFVVRESVVADVKAASMRRTHPIHLRREALLENAWITHIDDREISYRGSSFDEFLRKHYTQEEIEAMNRRRISSTMINFEDYQLLTLEKILSRTKPHNDMEQEVYDLILTGNDEEESEEE